MKLGMMAIVSSNCFRFWIFVGFLSRYHLPCICNSLELEPVILQCLLHFGTVTLHFAWYLLHLAMFAFHFAWYLSYIGISTSDVGLLRVLWAFI